jgi:hypothetical protein
MILLAMAFGLLEELRKWSARRVDASSAAKSGRRNR